LSQSRASIDHPAYNHAHNEQIARKASHGSPPFIEKCFVENRMPS
jgi:hypothetical protein